MYLLSSIAVQMTVISTINTSFSSHKKTSLCFQKEANNKNLLEVLLERELNALFFVLLQRLRYYTYFTLFSKLNIQKEEKVPSPPRYTHSLIMLDLKALFASIIANTAAVCNSVWL